MIILKNVVRRQLDFLLLLLITFSVTSIDVRAETHYLTEGGRNDLSPDGKWVYFDRVVSEKPFEIEIYKIRIDGTQEKCLTCNMKKLPAIIGQPLAHPSNKGLLFQGLTHTASLKPKSSYYHPSWGFNNDFYWLDFTDNTIKIVLDCSKIFGKGFGSACLHPQFSPDGTKLLFSSRKRAGLVQDPWEWWSPAVTDFDPVVGKTSNLKLIFKRNKKAFYETHQIFDDGSFIYSFGAGHYPREAAMYLPGKRKKVLWAPNNGDWVEHAHLLPNREIILNTSHNIWKPRSGIKALRMEVHKVVNGQLDPLTAFGAVSSDFSCHDNEFCVVQKADLSNSSIQPQLYILKLTGD